MVHRVAPLDKPHHFVDIVTALGDGGTDFQPHPYGHAVHSVAKELLAHRDVVLCIELGADDICLALLSQYRRAMRRHD